MRSRYKFHEAHYPYFITSTIVEWLPVFTTSACCDIIVNALQHARQHKDLKIYAWVVMDNHFHAIVSGPDLSKTIRGLKGFTAQVLIDQLKSEGRTWLLEQLALHCAAHKKASDHQVWQEGVHPQALEGDAMIEQKLDYLHQNPVHKGLVVAPEHWRYSSAHEWLVGGHPLFACDRWE